MKKAMEGNTPFSDDPAYQAAWTELLRQLCAAGARDSAFWAALGQGVAANDRVCVQHTPRPGPRRRGDWATALQRYRWWMQEHADGNALHLMA
jgi:hypothetical protein